MRRPFPMVVALTFFNLMNLVMAERTRSPSMSPEISQALASSPSSSSSQFISSVAITGGMIFGLGLLFCLTVRLIDRCDRRRDNRLFASTLTEPLLSEAVSCYQEVIDGLNATRKARGEDEIAIPEQFLCPITLQIMLDPALDKQQLNDKGKKWIDSEEKEAALLAAELTLEDLVPSQIEEGLTKPIRCTHLYCANNHPSY